MQSFLPENSETKNAKKIKNVERRRKQILVARDASSSIESISFTQIFKKEGNEKLNKIIYQRSWMRASKCRKRKSMSTMTYSKFKKTIPKILKKSASKLSSRPMTPTPPLPPPRLPCVENLDHNKNCDSKPSTIQSKKVKQPKLKPEKKNKQKLVSKTKICRGNTNWIPLECHFCKEQLPDRIYGPYDINNLKIYVHEHCLIWSTGIYLKENGELHGLQEAVMRRKKCLKCNRPFATIFCSVKRCNAVFHWPCIKNSDDYDISSETFLIRCKKHFS